MDFALLAYLLDLVLQDAEDEHVPALTVLVSGLAEDALLPQAVAPQRVGAQTVVFVHVGLDAARPQHVDRIVRDALAGLHTKSATGRLRAGEHGLQERVAGE